MINETTKARAHLVQRNKKGFTLTEIAIVLGIIGLILGAIWTAAAAVYNNQRIAHAQTAVLQIAQAVRGLYANANSDTGLSTGSLITAGAVPADLIDSTGAAMIDPFPAGVTTVTATGDGNGFVIQMTKVPVGACVNLLMAVGGANRDPALFEAQAAAATIAVPAITPGAMTLTTTPVLAASPLAANGFGGCTSGTAMYVAFGFGLKA